MIEFNVSTADLRHLHHHGRRLRDLDPADRHLLHRLVPATGGAAMSAEASVLFDAPGPKARRRHRSSRWSATRPCSLTAVSLVRALAGERPAHCGQVEPVPRPGDLDVLPAPRHCVATLVAAFFSVVLSMICGILLGMGRLSQLAPVRGGLRCLRGVLPRRTGADDDALRLLLLPLRHWRLR